MLCKCGRKAIYVRKWEGSYYCDRCLTRKVEKAFKKAIRENKLISKSDRRIGVGLSGGKDSSVLLYLMKKFIIGKEIVPIIIDEGIRGYRDKSIKVAIDFSKSLGLEPVVKRFSDYIGELDSLVRMGFREKPCSICGISRRYLLNLAAKEINADKLAIGHNLDDEATSILMNVLKNDPNRFNRLGFMPPEREGFVTRIKPLRMIPEKEIVIYANVNNIPYFDDECPYSRDNFRRDVLNLINDMEAKYPGTKIQIVKFYDRLYGRIGGLEKAFSTSSSGNVGRCKICGQPSSQEICRFCQLRLRLDKV